MSCVCVCVFVVTVCARLYVPECNPNILHIWVGQQSATLPPCCMTQQRSCGIQLSLVLCRRPVHVCCVCWLAVCTLCALYDAMYASVLSDGCITYNTYMHMYIYAWPLCFKYAPPHAHMCIVYVWYVYDMCDVCAFTSLSQCIVSCDAYDHTAQCMHIYIIS